MKPELTETQNRVYKFIKAYIEGSGKAPSIRETAIGAGLGSTSTVHGILSVLKEKGYISYEPSKSRSVVLTRHVRNSTVYIHIVSDIEVNNGSPCPKSFDGTVEVPADLVTGRCGVFAVKLKNDYPQLMLCKGDIVLCEEENNFKADDIVVSSEKNGACSLFRYSDVEGRPFAKVFTAIRIM